MDKIDDQTLSSFTKILEKNSVAKLEKMAINYPTLTIRSPLNLRHLTKMNQTINTMSKFSEIMRPQIEAMQIRNKDMEKLRKISRLTSDIPNFNHLLHASFSLGEMVRPFESFYPSISVWEKILSNRLLNLNKIAKLSNLSSQSIFGFAKLARLNDAIHLNLPYSDLVTELIHEEFGDYVEDNENFRTADKRDEAVIKAGFDQDLIAFPHKQMGEVMISAGFNFSPPAPPKFHYDQCEENNLIINQKHKSIITSIELHLRCLIVTKLSKIEPHHWEKRRIPGLMLRNWRERQESDFNEGKHILNLIYYSDFMDLQTIIIRKDNWNDVFSSVFHHKEGFIETMRRLGSIRNAISHSRPLGRTDIVTLEAEAMRIFYALGIKV